MPTSKEEMERLMLSRVPMGPTALSMKEKALRALLEKNKRVPFVERMLMASPPIRENPDGTVSTHLMSSAGVGGKEIAFPTLRWVGGKWVESDDPSGAVKAGDFLEFPTWEEADEFARGSWKRVVK